MYKVEYTKSTLKTLSKMDRTMCAIIFAWIEKNLQDCENPRAQGKALTGDKKGLWRYRIGSYRLIADIRDDKITILILNIGHRNSIYKH